MPVVSSAREIRMGDWWWGCRHPSIGRLVMNTTPAVVSKAASTAGGRVGRHRCIRPRTLHLIDLENLLAGRVDTDTVADIWDEYRQVTGMRWDDHVIVAVSKRNAAATFFALPETVQRVIGSNGPDGADLALISAVDINWAVKRFGQVMVATGDHIFTDTTTGLRAAGLPVVQVIGGGAPAADLYRQCTSQLYLPAAQRRAQTRRHTTLTAAMAA